MFDSEDSSSSQNRPILTGISFWRSRQSSASTLLAESQARCLRISALLRSPVLWSLLLPGRLRPARRPISWLRPQRLPGRRRAADAAAALQLRGLLDHESSRGEPEHLGRASARLLLAQGFGFLVLANGRLDAEILGSSGRTTSARLRSDGRTRWPPSPPPRASTFPLALFSSSTRRRAVGCCPSRRRTCWAGPRPSRRRLPARRLPERPAGGRGPRPHHHDGAGHPAAHRRLAKAGAAAVPTLHHVAYFVYQDACPPSNGCTLHPPPSAPAGRRTPMSGSTHSRRGGRR